MLIDVSQPRARPTARGASSSSAAGVAPLVSPGAGVDFRSQLWRDSPVAAPSTTAATATIDALPVGQPARPPGGFLAELEQEVQRNRATADNTDQPDLDALARNARLANAACRAVLDYWTLLAEHLNALKMAAPGRYVFDARSASEASPGHGFRVSSDLRTTHAGDEHFESVVLNWRVGKGERLKLHKVFPVEIERLRSRLRFAGVNAAERPVRDPASGHPRGTEFEFVADVNANVRVTPLHEAGRVRLSMLNVGAIERVEAELPAFAMRPAELDELARLICGRPNSLLKHAQNIVRHEP
jgi:hypothetical protein